MPGPVVKRVALSCLLALGIVAALADAAPAQERYGASVASALSDKPKQRYELSYIVLVLTVGGGLAVVLRPSFRQPHQT